MHTGASTRKGFLQVTLGALLEDLAVTWALWAR